MIVNVFDTRAPGKHEAAPAEKGLNVVVVKITKDMTMEQVVSEIKTKVEEKGGGPGSISLMRFFGHGNAGTMEFGKVFRYWTVEPLKELASYFDPEGKGLELHGCYTGSAVHVPGQDCSKSGRFYPDTHHPGRVGLGYELLYELSFQMKVPVTGGVNCQYGDSAHKLEGPTITVSPDGITMRNVPIDKYDDRDGPVEKPKKADSTPDVSERIHILEGDTPVDYKSDTRDALEGGIQDSTPDISERIHVMEDTSIDFDTPLDDTDENYQNWDHDLELDVSERIHILEEPFEETDFDTDPEDTWQPDSFDEFDKYDRDEFFPEHESFVDTKDTIPDFDDEFSDFDQDNDFEVPAFDILKDTPHGNLWKDHDFEVPAFDILKDTPHETFGKDHDFTPPSAHGDTFGSRSLWERSLHPLENTNKFHDTFDNSPPFRQNKQFQEPFHPIQPPEPSRIDFQTPNWQPQNRNTPKWLKK